MNIYETPKLLGEYLLFHYGTEAEVLPWDFGPASALNFAVRSVTKLLDPALVPVSADVGGTRALDLGCAVGRSAYELAAVCQEVTGIDYSQSFVDAAEKIRRDGLLPYLRIDEGSAQTPLSAKRPVPEAPAGVRFEQGDAMNLRPDLGGFDVVHAANLLCRLTDPQRLLKRLPSLVKPGGQLLLTTPCTWLEEFTPPERWPKGSTLEWLSESLQEHFELVHQEDLPFLIREHARKFQWSVALGSRWVRK
ncbi:MAG: putative 4-mercaptohistidine N1-methyltransferase [Verrucomicrobium sp.]